MRVGTGTMSSLPRRRMTECIGFAVLCCVLVACRHGTESDAPPAEPGAEFEAIFDGETLGGWHAVPVDSASEWSVERG